MNSALKIFFSQCGLMAAFLTIGSTSFAAGIDHRSYVKNLPNRYTFYHEAIDRQYEVNVQATIESFLDPKTITVEVDDKPNKYVEFYERAKLVRGSYVSVAGRKLHLTCLWVHGQTRISSKEVTTYLRKMIFVINDEDCQGPVTDLGDDRWDSFLELTTYNPLTQYLKEGRLVLNGNNLAIGLTPLEWQDEDQH